jgi:glycosyltransferase involved in cell wall biosynthesis
MEAGQLRGTLGERSIPARRLRMSAAARPADPRISVVIPTLNEARNLPAVLEALPCAIHELIVVDAKSSDGTVAVARRAWPGVRVVHQLGRGKGDALALGFAAATGDLIITIDGDGSTDPREIPRFVDALTAGADFAKGSRFLTGGGSLDLTRVRRFGARNLTTLVNVLFRTRYTDLCYGYNAFWRDCLPRLATTTIGFEVETVLHLSAVRSGLRVVEVPSFEHRRVHGTSNLNIWRDGLRVLRAILAERLRRPAKHERRATPFPKFEAAGIDLLSAMEDGASDSGVAAVRDAAS